MGNVEEYKKALEEYEKKQQKKAKLFNPKALVAKAREIQTIEDPEHGTIKYGILTMQDLLEINSTCKTNEERSVQILYRMLKKAYPDFTLEEVRDMPMEDAAYLLSLLSEKAGFLQPKTASMNGLNPA
jgi:hypothetical protein